MPDHRIATVTTHAPSAEPTTVVDGRPAVPENHAATASGFRAPTRPRTAGEAHRAGAQLDAKDAMNTIEESPRLTPLPEPAEGIRCWAISLADTEAAAPAMQDLLSTSELARADRYGTPALRARYVVGRAALRQLLGSLLAVAPDRVALKRGRRGRPELDDDTRLDFNVSHTRDVAIVGVVARGRIGVDIEHEDRLTNADGLARKFLTPRERASLAGLDTDARRRRFLALWTCKEAMSKATGDALSAPFRELDVELGEKPRLVGGPAPYVPVAWRLRRLETLPGFIATVALWDTATRS